MLGQGSVEPKLGLDLRPKITFRLDGFYENFVPIGLQNLCKTVVYEMFGPGAHAKVPVSRIIRHEYDLYFWGHINL
jgi:hypothetical protein